MPDVRSALPLFVDASCWTRRCRGGPTVGSVHKAAVTKLFGSHALIWRGRMNPALEQRWIITCRDGPRHSGASARGQAIDETEATLCLAPRQDRAGGVVP